VYGLVHAARKAIVPENYILRAIDFARQGYVEMVLRLRPRSSLAG
jgi:hypothetical protein